MFKRFFLLLILFLSLWNTNIFAKIKIPEYHGYVNDYANLFSDQEEEILTENISDLEKKTSVEIGILTIESLEGQPVFDYSMAVARGWGIGKKDKNNGLLILIAKKEKKVRIEVGYGLEGVITDAQAFWLIDEIFKPKFREGKYFEGVNLVLGKISDAILKNYKIPEKEKNQKILNLNDDLISILMFLVIGFFAFLDTLIIFIVKSLGKTKSWYLGGLVGGGGALGLGLLFFSTATWVFIVSGVLFVLGLILDYFISKWYSKLNEEKRKKWEEEFRKKLHSSSNSNSGIWIGGSSGSGGGFDFGGGDFGGGGSDGSW